MPAIKGRPRQSAASSALLQARLTSELKSKVELAAKATRLSISAYIEQRTSAADAAIRRLAAEAQDPIGQARILPACVEILLAGGDVPGARGAAEDLAGAAAALDSPFVRALTSHAQGAVLLAEGDPGAALAPLRVAWARCRELDLPYPAAERGC